MRFHICFWKKSDECVVQQEVDNADIENAVVVIPTLADIVTHNDLRKRVTGERKGLILGDGLFLGSQRIGRLNISLLAAGSGNEVDLPCRRCEPALGRDLQIDRGTVAKYYDEIIQELQQMKDG